MLALCVLSLLGFATIGWAHVVGTAYAADAVILTGRRSTSADVNFAKVAEFYGLKTRRVVLGGPGGVGVPRAGSRTAILGVSEQSLRRHATLDERRSLLAAVRNGGSLLVYELVRTDTPVVSSALGRGARVLDVASRPGCAVSSEETRVTREFTGIRIDGSLNSPSDRCLAGLPKHAVRLASVADTAGIDRPVFARVPYGRGSIFLLSTHQGFDLRKDQLARVYRAPGFSQIVPLMMFVRYAGGDAVWHRDEDTTNLTIDDPYLVEPYGNLSFFGLLGEMESHDFHTTIAFVPRYYDHSNRRVARLFADRPDRFSIAVHGNNHGLGELSSGSSEQDVRMTLNQAQARMSEFQRRTGVSYDEVMVFPRRLGTLDQLRMLRDADFLASANARDMPLGARAPSDFRYAMRPAITDYAGFPLLARRHVSPGGDISPVAFDLFIDRPGLFYAHQDYFVEGSDAFSGIADDVNHLAQKPKWASLGYIAKRLYLERTNADGSVDIATYGVRTVLSNTTKRTRTYHVYGQLAIGDSAVPQRVTFGGRRLRFRIEAGRLRTSVAIPAHSSGELLLVRRGAPARNLASDVGTLDESSIEVRLARLASDVRDRYLSTSVLGRAVLGARGWIAIALLAAFSAAATMGMVLLRWRRAS